MKIYESLNRRRRTQRYNSKKYRRKNPDYYTTYKKENIVKVTKSIIKSRLKIKYNLTEEQYDQLLKNQNYKCLICQNDFDMNNTKAIHVDHCHETNIVRGILCGTCNKGLGLFKDNIEYLQSAIKYLKRFL